MTNSIRGDKVLNLAEDYRNAVLNGETASFPEWVKLSAESDPNFWHWLFDDDSRRPCGRFRSDTRGGSKHLKYKKNMTQEERVKQAEQLLKESGNEHNRRLIEIQEALKEDRRVLQLKAKIKSAATGPFLRWMRNIN